MKPHDKSTRSEPRSPGLPPPLRSASHPLAREARLIARGPKERRAERLFLVEGRRGVAEAIAAGGGLVWVLVDASSADRLAEEGLVELALASGAPVQPVEHALFERLAPSRHGASVLAACGLPERADRPDAVVEAARDGLLVLTWGLQDPGNLGTVIRSARAFGASGLVALGGADPWSPKTVRATAGAIHRLPVARGEAETARALALVEPIDGPLYAAVASGGASLDDVVWSRRGTLLIGAEVAGLPPELEREATRLTIDTGGRVESLSAPIAASILLCEYARSTRSAR